MPRYKCIGCGEIHNDNDYCKEDGDVLIECDILADFHKRETWRKKNMKIVEELQSFKRPVLTPRELQDLVEDYMNKGMTIKKIKKSCWGKLIKINVKDFLFTWK